MRSLLYLLLAVSLFACRGRESSPLAAEGDTLSFKYARGLSVVRYPHSTVVTLHNPWKQGLVLHRYVLVPADSALPAALPEGTLVRTPLRRSLLFTTVHCALLQSFHREECIAGVADLKYISLPSIHRRVQQGRIIDVGDSQSPLVERIIDSHPDAILLSPFENNGGYGKIESLGIPIIECADYMEHSPLARAEWVRFYGLLFGCEHEADSLFALVSNHYQRLCQIASRAPSRPRVLIDKMMSSVWYVPGGRSTIGQMIQDAHTLYPWAADTRSGSLALPFESVLERAGDADVWLFRYSGRHDITLPELLSEHHGYRRFRAVGARRVYGCDVSRSQFYEETPFRPDLLLADFILMLHPQLPVADSLRYFHSLSDGR